MQALDVSAEDGLDPDRLDEAVKVQLHARLVAVGIRVDHPGRVGLLAQDRADRAVEFGVHQDHVLAVLDRGRDGARAVLDCAGDLDQGLDLRVAGEQQRILRHRVAIGADRFVEFRLVRGLDDIPGTSLRVGAMCLFDVPVRDRHEPHARDGAQDLKRYAAAHEAGADHRYADRISGASALFERGINNDHRSKSGQLASFSDRTAFAGSGQSIPNAGSFQRTPPSADGV